MDGHPPGIGSAQISERPISLKTAVPITVSAARAARGAISIHRHRYLD